MDKHVKCTIRKDDVNPALLQIQSVPIGAGLPSPASLLFSRPIRGLLPQMYREPTTINTDDAYYEALKIHQNKYLWIRILIKAHFTFP